MNMIAMAPTAGTVPLYRHLMDEIAEQLRTGTWAADEKLPTEAELCAAYGVSVITVRRALSELASQGLLYRVQGKGTFAAPARDITVPNELMYQQFGDLPGQHQPIGVTVVEPPADVAVVLNLDQGAHAVRIARSKVADGRPIKFEQAYVSVASLPSSWRRTDFERDATFLELFTGQSLRPSSTQIVITSALPSEDEQRYLQVDASQPLLRLRRIALDSERRPLWLTDNSTNLSSYVLEMAVPPLA